MKTSTKIILGILLVLLLIGPSSAWLGSYVYRQPFTVGGSTAWLTNLTNYTVHFTVYNTSGASDNFTAYTNGRSQPTWYDLKFTDSSDNLLSHWINVTGSTYVDIWVEIPFIENVTPNTTYYMYYSNPFATDTSNISEAFKFGDDFSGTTLDNVTRWGPWISGSGSLSGGNLELAVNSQVQSNASFIQYAYNYTVGTKWRKNTGAQQLGVIVRSANPGTNTHYYQWIQGTYHYVYRVVNPSTLTRIGTYGAFTPTVGTWYLTNYTVHSKYTHSSRINEGTAYGGSDSMYYGAGCIGFKTMNGGTAGYSIDYVFVKDYVTPEPTIQWGAEDVMDYIITFDKDVYAAGEIATINTTFPDDFWDTVNYTYYVDVYKYPDLVTPITSYALSSKIYEKPLDTASLGVGTYYAMAYLADVATGLVFFVDYDYASVSNGIALSGIVFNATSGASLVGATVEITQGGATTSYTSDLSGYETTSPLNIGQEINVTGYMTGYTTNTHLFTPSGPGDVTYPIPLVPNDTEAFFNWTTNGTSIGGLITQMPYYAPASLAYVNLSNATWYSNITTGMPGYYQFDGLNNTTDYTLVAGKASFSDHAATVTSGELNFTWYNFTLGSDFDLTVYVKDAVSGAPITANVTIDISNILGWSDSDLTSTGETTFTNLSGEYTLSAMCLGYSSTTETVNVDMDKTATLFMSYGNATGVYYTPHNVEITVQDNYGNGLADTYVTITPTTTTLSSWTWLQELLGLPSSPDLSTATMTEQTDTNGAITFVMVAEVKYKVDCLNVPLGVNETIYLFPKDDQYVVQVDTDTDFEEPADFTEDVTYVLANETVNTTHENLTLTYYDASGSTTNLSFWVKSHSSPVGTCYQAYAADPNNCNFGYVCGAYNGQDYYYGFNATTAYGDISASYGITYQKLVDLGIPAMYYPWLAAGFIIVISALFSVLSVKFGAVLIPIFAFMFYYMKWITLSTGGMLLCVTLLTIGVFAYVRKQEDKVGG